MSCFSIFNLFLFYIDSTNFFIHVLLHFLGLLIFFWLDYLQLKFFCKINKSYFLFSAYNPNFCCRIGDTIKKFALGIGFTVSTAMLNDIYLANLHYESQYQNNLIKRDLMIELIKQNKSYISSEGEPIFQIENEQYSSKKNKILENVNIHIKKD